LSSKPQTGPSSQAEVFTYPPLPVEKAAEDVKGKTAWAVTDRRKPGINPQANEEREKQTWRRGFEEGSAKARIEYEKNLAAARSETSQALRDFAVARESYFQRVEQEVVRLTLAIARKILHREAQVDPLLLTGVLRVALEKVQAGTNTRLRANPADIRIWRDYFAQTREEFPAPELIGDPQLEPFRCILETELGTTEIGLETQLKEIEQGFLDLLSQRPGSA
jgi:flagellar biosynthesis/type III secretory pathway protein FliH